MPPCISVIIPVYNAEKYLRECLDSVCDQTFQEIEIICVNDGSTDKSLEILTEYKEKDNRIQIVNQSNAGAGAARNKGIEIAQGEYLAFIDADDFWKPRLLETAYCKIKSTYADLCLFTFAVYNEQTGIISKTHYMSWLPVKKVFRPMDYRDRLFQMAAPGPGFCLYRRKLIEDFHLTFLPQHVAEDIYFVFLSMAFASKISYIQNVDVIVRRGMTDNLSSSLWKYPEETQNSLLMIKNRLQSSDLFKTYRKTFRIAAISSCEYLFLRVPTDILPKRRRLQMLEELEIADKSCIIEYKEDQITKIKIGKMHTLYRMLRIYGIKYTSRFIISSLKKG